jgi:alkaline phosphatase D
VRFILTDLRSSRVPITAPDNEAKTMLGTAQKRWFKSEFARRKRQIPLIFWVTSVPWLGGHGTNYYPLPVKLQRLCPPSKSPARANQSGPRLFGRSQPPAPEDHWSLYSVERREIADFIKQNAITGLCIIHGDAHMLAADNGSNADYATGGGAPIPVIAAAPLDQAASIKGGPYSQGIYKPSARRRLLRASSASWTRAIPFA